MGLIRDDRQGGLNKTKLKLPTSPPTQRPAVRTTYQPGSAQYALLQATGGTHSYDRAPMMRPEDLAAAHKVTPIISTLANPHNITRALVGTTATQALHNLASLRHPQAFLAQQRRLTGPSAGTVLGPAGEGAPQIPADQLPLYQAAAVDFHFRVHAGGEPAQHLNDVASRYGLAQDLLHQHVQSSDPTMAEILSNKDPQTEQMSPRYRVNQLENLLARVKATQAEAQAKAIRLNDPTPHATLGRAGAEHVLGSAYRNLRDMRLAKSEIQAYKEVNPGGTPPERQIGFRYPPTSADPATWFDGTVNGVMGHGTREVYDHPSDHLVNWQDNLFHGGHFFSDNGHVTSDYSNGWNLPTTHRFSQVAGSPMAVLAAREAYKNDPLQSLLPGAHSNLADELAKSPRIGGNYMARQITREDLNRLPPDHIFRNLNPETNPSYGVFSKQNGLLQNYSYDEQMARHYANQQNAMELGRHRTTPEAAQEAYQMGSHQQAKLWLKQNKWMWTRGTPEQKQLYEDTHQLVNDSHAQREIRNARQTLARTGGDPLVDPARYVLTGESVSHVPNIRLHQLDFRNSLNLDSPLSLVERAKLLRAYGEVVARQSGQHIAIGPNGERHYGLPYDDPRVTAPFKEAGRAWLKSRLQPDQMGHSLKTDNPEDLFAAIAHDIGPKNLRAVIKRAGFGGLAHKGGARVGNQGHNVAIVNYAKQIRDPWVDPKALLNTHKEQGKAVIDSLHSTIKLAQDLGIDMSGVLPKEALQHQPTVWDRIYEGRAKDIARHQETFDATLPHAREAARDAIKDLHGMFDAVRQMRTPHADVGYPDARSDFNYFSTSFNHGPEADFSPTHASLKEHAYYLKQLRNRIKLLKDKQSRM